VISFVVIPCNYSLKNSPWATSIICETTISWFHCWNT